MGLPTWHYMEMYEKAAARNEVLETRLRILAKANDWLIGVSDKVLGTADIEELCEIEREVGYGWCDYHPKFYFRVEDYCSYGERREASHGEGY